MSCKCNTCTICLEDMNEEGVRYLPCCHGFHTKCIDEWLKTHDTCPECRLSLANGLVFDGSIMAMTDLEYNHDNGTYTSTGNQYFTEVIENNNGIVSLGSVDIFKKDICEVKEYVKTKVSLVPSNPNFDNTLLLTFPEKHHPHAIARAVNQWDDNGDLYKKIKMAAFQEYIFNAGLHTRFVIKNEEDLIAAFLEAAVTSFGAEDLHHPQPDKNFETFLDLCRIDPYFVEIMRKTYIEIDQRHGLRHKSYDEAVGLVEKLDDLVRRIIVGANTYPKYVTNLSQKIECAVENKIFVCDEMNSVIEATWSVIKKCSETWIEKNQKERELFLNSQIQSDELKLGDFVKKVKGKGRGGEGRVVFIASKGSKVKVRVMNNETGRNWGLQSSSNYERRV